MLVRGTGRIHLSKELAAQVVEGLPFNASHYMKNGGDILTLQRVLGHATLAMTMKYAHLSPWHMVEVVKLNPLAIIVQKRKSKELY